MKKRHTHSQVVLSPKSENDFVKATPSEVSHQKKSKNRKICPLLIVFLLLQ